ncbi:MAG: cytoskeletal protein binding protein [Bogoriella megaspora]|nr:MAG: cytoskeletal protein binding protein [Bogoriella megaspora]
MGFLGVYRAVYDYVPQGENELPIQEGDLLFVLEKSTEDDWWRAKKRATSEDEEEPEGLIPNNYIEEAEPMLQAKALYDYTRQTDEELSFSETTILDVYDASDPDWTLVGHGGEYGFVPSNYIEEAVASPALPTRPRASFQPMQEPDDEPEPSPMQPPTPTSPTSPPANPAAALAGIIAQRTGTSEATSNSRAVSIPPPVSVPPRQQYTPEDSDEEVPAPRLPQRSPSVQLSPPPTQYASPRSEEPPGILPSPPHNRAVSQSYDESGPVPSPGGYHLYNIHEMIQHMGKNKKMPMTLGINIAKGIIMIAPEKARDGPQKEWTAEKLTHYSIEGKHVFIELVRPSRSIDFHAGAKDTAQEIVSALGELAGAARAGGLREVIAAGSGSANVQRKGKMLYEFMAQGEDEVTVAVDDEVIVIDDTKSDDWWMVRRLKNGKEGVVPSSYVEITETIQMPSSSGINAGRSFVEQNRAEEERIARQASKANRRSETQGAEVGPGLQLPERGSSLHIKDVDNSRSSQRSKRESRTDSRSASSSKPSKLHSHSIKHKYLMHLAEPDSAKVRTWTDRSGSFKVDAEFLGLKDGKIHLHKVNGVKIAVPVVKMSIEDLEFVERKTGVSLDEDKPLSNIKRRSTQREKPTAGASVEPPKKPEYDWFDFFLQCGVNPQICERYAQAFSKDQMGQENLVDIEPPLLRTLGLKEGDILRVMKFLDNKFARSAAREKRNVSFGGASVLGDGEAEAGEGGLFSGPAGTLRNNTRKGRPAPAVQTNDVVDPKVFEQKTDGTVKKPPPADSTATPLTSAPERQATTGFDDNAWDVKPSKQEPAPAAAPTPPPASSAPTAQVPTATAPAPPPTGAMAELSLLQPALQPTPAPQEQQQPMPSAAPAPVPQPIQQPQQPQQPSQQLNSAPQGADPSFFNRLGQTPAGAPQLPPPQQQQQPGFAPQQTGFVPQQTGYSLQPLQQQQTGPSRQRPPPPQQTQSQGGLIAPPPPRASSAPQNFQQQSAFGPPPLQPQLTGYQQSPPNTIGPQIAPPGQSMQELSQQQRLQAQQQQQFSQPQMLPPQPTGFNPVIAQPTGYNQFSSPPPQMQPQPTGFNPSFPQQQPFLNGQAPAPGQPSPFADPPRFQPQPTGINSFLPPALQPQRTGINGVSQPAQPQSFSAQQIQAQNTGFAPQAPNGFGANGFQAPPVPSIPQQTGGLQPLQPQKTGPAPPVRFGVQNQGKLTPQMTGRRANLSQATPQNPFGF